MEIELGDEILDALSSFAKRARRAGLTRAADALDDAMIAVFNNLCADRHARETMKSGDVPVGCEHVH